MADDKIEIIINDVVSKNIEKTLDSIGYGAERASDNIYTLQESLGGLNKSFDKSIQSIQSVNISLDGYLSKTERQNNALRDARIANDALVNSIERRALAEEKIAKGSFKLKGLGLDLGKDIVGNSITEDKSKFEAARLQVIKDGYKGLVPEIEKATVAQDGMNKSLFTFHNLFIAFAVIRIADKVINIVDAYTLMENRLKLVSTSQAQTNFLQKEMFNIANEARVPVAELTQSFVRYDYALRGLGATQKESLRFTKTLSETLAISGLTTAEQTSSLLQLSQALNKGKLDGDEFRTIMETLPTLATAIAKEMGVARGELIKLAPQGKITAEAIRNAMASIASDTDEAFKNLAPTIGQSLTVMKNNVIKIVGEVNESIGLTSGLAKGIIGISNNLDILAVALAGVSTVLVQRFIPSILLASRALVLTPFGLIVTGITAIAGAVVYLQKILSEKQEDEIVFTTVNKLIDLNLNGIRNETAEITKLKKEYGDYLTLLISTKNAVKRGELTPESAKVLLDETSAGKKIKNAEELSSFKPKFLLTDQDRLDKEIKDTNLKYDIAIKDYEIFAKESVSQIVDYETDIETTYKKAYDKKIKAEEAYRKNPYYMLNTVGNKGIDTLAETIKADQEYEDVLRSIEIKKKELAFTEESWGIELDMIDSLNEARERAIKAIERESIEKEKVRIKDDVITDNKKYGITLQAVTELLKEGTISQYEYNLELQKTSLIQKSNAIDERAFTTSGVNDIAVKFRALKKFDDDVKALENRKSSVNGGLFVFGGDFDIDKQIEKLRASKSFQEQKIKAELQRSVTGTDDSTRKFEEEEKATRASLDAIFEIQMSENQKQIQSTEQFEKKKFDIKKKYEEQIKTLTAKTNKDITLLEVEQYKQMLSAASGAFANISELLKKTSGEHSKYAKAAFAIEKGLAAGEAFLNLYTAISAANKEENLGLKAAKIATAIAIGTSQIASIAASSIGKFAKGGLVQGKGSGLSDSIPAWLSNGEFVVDADTTSRNLELLKGLKGNASTTNNNNTVYNGGTKGNVIIHNYMGGEVEEKTNANGDHEIYFKQIRKKLAQEIHENRGELATVVNNKINRKY